MYIGATNTETSKGRVKASYNDPVLKRSFRGHKDSITAVQFNPNMKQAVSSSLDSTVIVWNFKPQLRPFRFVGHTQAVLDLCINTEGSLIASGSKDMSIRLWKNSVEGQSSVIKGHSGAVRTLDFSKDGFLLASGSDDKTIKIWTTKDRKFQYSIQAHINWVRSIQFAPDARLIASGSDDKLVKLWDLASKSLISSFSDHIGVVNSVKFHPDGTCVASCSADKKIKMWDIRSKKLLQHYDAHEASVNAISFHSSGHYLTSASADSTLKIWDLRQGHILYTLYGHDHSANAINFSTEGDFFCSGGSDSVVMIWQSNLQGDKTSNEQEIVNEEIKLSKKKKPSVKVSANQSSNKKPQSPQKIEKLSSFQPQVVTFKEEEKFASRRENSENILKPVVIQQVTNEVQPPPINVSSQITFETTTAFNRVIEELGKMTTTLMLLEQRMQKTESQVSHLMDIARESKNPFKASQSYHYSIQENTSENPGPEVKVVKEEINIPENPFLTQIQKMDEIEKANENINPSPVEK